MLRAFKHPRWAFAGGGGSNWGKYLELLLGSWYSEELLESPASGYFPLRGVSTTFVLIEVPICFISPLRSLIHLIYFIEFNLTLKLKNLREKGKGVY